MSVSLIYPLLWIPHWRVRRALIGYPLYDVPHKTRERDLPEPLARENFEYFERVRQKRLTFFSEWLRRHFQIDGSLTPTGVQNVSRWVDRFSGGLINNNDDVYSIYGSYTLPWLENHAGYNVIIDLGIFMGEYVISRRSNLYWTMYEGYPGEPGTFEGVNFRRPVLSGMPNGWQKHFLHLAFGIIVDRHKVSKIGHERAFNNKAAVIDDIKSALYLARLPENTTIIGDSKNEPL